MREQSRPPLLEDYALLPGEAVTRELGSNAEAGLTGLEAARLLAEYGPNELRAVSPMPIWRRVLEQFRDPLVYLLLGAIVVALLAWLIEGREGFPVDPIVIALVIVANAVLGFVQEARAANAVAALARMTAVTSSVLRDGVRRRIPSTELVPGDILLLEEGDAVGADGRLLLRDPVGAGEDGVLGRPDVVRQPPPVELLGVHPQPGNRVDGLAVVHVGKGRQRPSGEIAEAIIDEGAAELGVVARLVLDADHARIMNGDRAVLQVGKGQSVHTNGKGSASGKGCHERSR